MAEHTEAQKFTVLMTDEGRDYSFKGREGQDVAMKEYKLVVKDESGNQSMPTLSRSAKKDAPKVGDVIEATTKTSEKFGLQLVESRKGSESFQGSRSFGKSVDERKEIIAQKSVAEAINFMEAKGSYLARLFELNLIKEEEVTAHLKFYTGSSLGAMAKGIKNIIVDLADVAIPKDESTSTKPALDDDIVKTADIMTRMMPDGTPEQVIDPSEIPF